MVSQQRGIRDYRYVRRSQNKPPKQRGIRTTQHMFGRLISVTSAGVALAAFPLMPGESLRQVNWNFYACTDAGGTQPDSAIPYTLAMVYETCNWFETNSPYGSAAAVNGVLTRALEQANTGPFEWDPNPGENDASPQGPYDNQEVLFVQHRMLTPIGQPAFYEVAEVFTQGDARHVDKFTGSFKRNIYSRNGGVVVFGVYMPDVTAQTTFGVNDHDLTANTFQEVVESDSLSFDEMAAPKAYEMLYGGDRYIEADTLKDDDWRAQGQLQALVATPWPRVGFAR